MAWRFRWAAPGITIENSYAMNVVRYRSLIGADGPPYNVVNEEQPFRPGSYLKTITVDDAEIQLTMLLQGGNSQQLWQSMAPLPALFNPTATDANGNFGGRLVVSTPANATSRFLQCICLSGFKVDEPILLPNSVESTLSFYANYPYWQSYVLHTSEGTPFGRSPEWFPIFPIILGGGSENFVEVTVNNAGDVPAYPTIQIRGPGQSPKIENKTANEAIPNSAIFNLDGLNLSTNTQRITINMLNRTAVRNNSSQTSVIPFLTYDSSFWPLLPGDNVLRFTINNAQANTTISISWRDTYSSIV